MAGLKTVQIGCGGRAKTHAQAIRQTEALSLAAFCDLEIEKANSFKARFGNEDTGTYADFRAMLERETPEVVAFVAPPSVRSAVILPILAFKPKALVIEKPMAITLGEARDLVVAAEAAGTQLVVSHQCRYAEEMRGLCALVESGRLGRVEKVVAHCRLNLMEQGTHLLDLVSMVLGGQRPRWVLGRFDGVKGLYPSRGDTHPGCDHGLLQIEYDNGAQAFVAMGNRAPMVSEWPDRECLQFQLNVLGSEGFAKATLASGLKAYFADGEIVNHSTPKFDNEAYMTRALYEEVVEVLAGRVQKHQAAATGALEVQQLLEAAYESDLQERAIFLPHHPRPGTLSRMRHRKAARREVVMSTLQYGKHSRIDALRSIAACGFQSIDLWMLEGMAAHFLPGSEALDVLKTQLRELGLTVPMVSIYRSEPVVEKLKVARDLGARVAVMSGIRVSGPKASTTAIEKAREWLAAAQELGVTLAFENHVNTMETIEDMEALLAELDHPNAAICLAPTHLAICGQHAESALARLREKTAVLYLWDMNVYADPERHWKNGDAQIPGGGNLDFCSILSAAVQHAPRALWSLTWHGTENWPVDRIAEGSVRALRHIEQCRPLRENSIAWAFQSGGRRTAPAL